MGIQKISRRHFLGITGAGILANLMNLEGNSVISKTLAAMRGKVKITGIKTAVVQSNYTWNFVKILTDADIYGIGEAFCSPGVPALMKRFERTLIGKDPLNVESLYNQMMQSAFSWHTGVTLTAMAGLEIALWDLAGKILNVPCYHLLGGVYRDKVPLYCDSGAPREMTPSAWKEYAQELGQKNFTFYKVDIDPVTARKTVARDPSNRSLSNKEIELMAGFLGAVREGLGDKEMAVDCHAAYDISDATRLANALVDLKLYCLEDPIPTPNADAYKRITESTEVPICTGENLYGRDGFKDFIINQACDMIQPDTVKTGGLLETKKIADMADMWYMPIGIHNLGSPVGSIASAYVGATIRNFSALEFKSSLPSWWDDVIIHDKPLYQDGFIHLLDRPGLGVELNDDVCKAHAHPEYPYFE